MEIKKVLRKQFVNIRKNIKSKYKKEMDYNITKKVLDNEMFINAERILLYYSNEDEVDTQKIIEYSLLYKKAIFLPRVDNKKSEINFYRVRDLNTLLKSKINIFEPKKDGRTIYKLNKQLNDICIVPALATDKSNFRLGYGGGYYDKFLEKNTHLKTLCLCYNLFHLNSLPTSKNDVKCSIIISD